MDCQKCGKEVRNYNPNFSSYSLNFKCSEKWQYKFVQNIGGQKAEIPKKVNYTFKRATN